MRGLRGLKVARIRGVDVKLHFSLIFILAYVWLIGALQFPVMAQQAGFDAALIAGSPFVWGGLFAVALFLSVLIHELGHVIVAQKLGGTVDGITLMMLGGVSEIRRMPEGRYHEFKVAVIGPIVSLGLAGLLFLSSYLIAVPEWRLFSYWLGSVNVILAVFNMLPAFPLDGGRALRSILVTRQGKVKGTRTAVKVGNIFAILFGIIGFLQFNILLMLIALFLYAVAQRELTVVESMGALAGLKAGDIGQRLPAVDEREPVENAVIKMQETGSLVLPVNTITLEPATVSAAQISRVPANLRSSTAIGQIMEKDPSTVDVLDPLDAALTDLYSTENQALPLKRDGHLIGLIRVSDLTQALQFRLLGKPETRNLAS